VLLTRNVVASVLAQLEGQGGHPGSARGARSYPAQRSSTNQQSDPCSTSTEAAVLYLRSLIARLRLANQEFRQAERKLDDLCTALSENAAAAEDSGPGDAAILSSLPGVGTVTFATLLTEAAGPLACRDYAALRTLSGVAPVIKRSGKSCVVVMRYAAQARLRNAVFYWARIAVQHDPKCRGRYAALRARGHAYGRALRGVADRLLGVACVLLQRRTLFDPAHGTPAAP
jgi:transposase